MTTSRHYDVIVIGSGQAGGPLASALGAHGWHTAIVEQDHPGGTCVNYGCTPTKTMVASAEVAWVARRAGDYGVQTGDVSVDMSIVRKRKRDMVESFRQGSTSGLESAENVELIRGEARFTGDKQIEVNGPHGPATLTADRFFINTGTRNSTPPIDGLDSVDYLDSTSIMELDYVPEHLIVIGGGYIGLEFGQMFRRFGSRVTIIQRGGQLLNREDRELADAVRSILEEDGITVLMNTDVERVAAFDGGGIRVSVGDDVLDGSDLLVAIGRRPNTDVLAPEVAGIEVDDKGFVVVNERLETNVPNVWALGEVAGQPAFTHISYDDFRIVRSNLLDGGNRSTSDRLVSYVAYIDPQFARVGMSESEAREAGHDIRVASMPMERVARALQTDETRGMMKAIVDAGTDRILGAAILGAEGGEIMSIIQTAMMADLPFQTLRDAPYAHPTFAESLNNLFNSFNE